MNSAEEEEKGGQEEEGDQEEEGRQEAAQEEEGGQEKEEGRQEEEEEGRQEEKEEDHQTQEVTRGPAARSALSWSARLRRERAAGKGPPGGSNFFCGIESISAGFLT